VSASIAVTRSAADQPTSAQAGRDDAATSRQRHRFGVGLADPTHRCADLLPIGAAGDERRVPGRHHFLRGGGGQLARVRLELSGEQLLQVAPGRQGRADERPCGGAKHRIGIGQVDPSGTQPS